MSEEAKGTEEVRSNRKVLLIAAAVLAVRPAPTDRVPEGERLDVERLARDIASSGPPALAAIRRPTPGLPVKLMWSMPGCAESAAPAASRPPRRPG